MKYTEAKANQLESMVKTFARKHGLTIDVRHDENLRDHVYVSMIYAYMPYRKVRYYWFDWNRWESLSEGAAYIFADMINDVNNKSMNNNSDAFAETVPKIQDVIFNDPATIIKWADGTKTVVKAQDGDAYDPEKGLAMAIAKKALGNKGNYNNEINKWLSKYDPPILYPEVMIKFDSRTLTNALHERMANIFGRDVISDVNKSIEETKH